mgnify:CR=1 FL=1
MLLSYLRLVLFAAGLLIGVQVPGFINDYAKRNQILTLDDRTEVATQGFASISAALSRAEEDRIKAESQYKVPNQSIFQIGLGMVAPTILAHASDEFGLELHRRGGVPQRQPAGAGRELAVSRGRPAAH